MKWIISLKSLIAGVLCATLSIILSVATGIAATETAQSAATPVMIQSVQMRGEGAGAELMISVSAPATYTSYKTTAPDRLVIDFSQIIPAENLGDLKIDNGPVKGVTLRRFDTDAGALTRMEVFLSQDIAPVIFPSTEKIGELRISFPGFKVDTVPLPVTQEAAVSVQPEVASAQLPPEPQKDLPAQPEQPVQETTVSVITDVIARAGGIAILSQGGAINDYKTFRLNKPERIVVDIPNAKASMTNTLVQLNVAGVSTARVGNYPDKVRVVLDAVNGSLADASFEKSASGLQIMFAAAGTEKQTERVVSPAPEKTLSVPVLKEQTVSVPKAAAVQTSAQMTALDFQVVEGTSRIMVKVTGAPLVEDPVKTPGSVSFRIKNTQLPRSLQRSFEAREFVSPVLRVTPVQVRTKAGNDVLVRVTLKVDATFEMKRETDIISLDIKHPADMAKKPEEPAKIAGEQKASSATAASGQIEQITAATEQNLATGKHRYTGRKVTLEFADAEVRKIFQLLAEVSNKNFVLGDEVGGTISLKLVNVPWDQALDIILDTKGMDKREDGNIILVRGKGKFKSLMDEEVEIRKAALKGEPLETVMFDVNYADLGSIVSQFSALKTDRGMITQDQRTNKVIVKDVKTALEDMRKILVSLDVPEKQVMIEARIVEASSTFTQSLGVNWGVHYRDGAAAIAGINSMDTSFGGLATNVAPAGGVSGSPGAAAGISFGTLASNIKLDLRLNAAVSAGLVRIVSTPRVATLNHKTAKITQGQQIPYTSSTSDKVETKFVEAALALEVTPHINPNGTVVMKIDAKNDAPGSTGSPPPINKKQATTEMMLRDGETTVIGGIYVESDTSGEEGVPYLKDVPWLGGLFKSTDTKRNRNELLIFITPRIINSN